MRSALVLLLAVGMLAGLRRAVRAEDASARPTSLALRVATYNAWLLPLASRDRSRRLARMPVALRACAVDVLCLQEVWLAADKQRLADALRPSLPHAVQAPGGLMLLSRFPVLSSRYVRFPSYKGLSLVEILSNKGLLDVVLETPCGALRVVTAHTALTFGPDNPRSKQLAFLVAHIAARRDHPLVLPADLNTWPVDEGRLTSDYQDLLRPGLVDANPPVRRHDQKWDPGPATRFAWPRVEGAAGWYPDHILFRSGETGALALRAFAMTLDTKQTALSDHNLLYADLTLTDRRARDPAVEAR
jgi:endonuclease/exonuclease/phosphatase family metal-dependent hydrolase